MPLLKEGDCPICKINFTAKISKSHPHGDRSVLNAGVSLIFAKYLAPASPDLTWDTTCDICFRHVEELVQLHDLVKETQVKIEAKLQWIWEQIGNNGSEIRATQDEVEEYSLVARPLTEEEEQEFQELGSLHEVEIKSEPPDDENDHLDLEDEEHHPPGEDNDVDVDIGLVPWHALDLETRQKFISSETLALPLITETPSLLCTKDRTTREKRARKRKVPFDELAISALKPKRYRNYKRHESIQVHIQKKTGTENSFTLTLDNFASKSQLLGKRKVAKLARHNVENNFPELRVTLQDFANLLPSQAKKHLDPLADCRFSLGKKQTEEKCPNIKINVDVTKKDDLKDVDQDDDKVSHSFSENESDEDQGKDPDFNDSQSQTRRKRKTKTRARFSSDSNKSKSKKNVGKHETSLEEGATKIPIPEVNFRDLNSLTEVDGRKYFLHYEFKAQTPYLLCGFPGCDFMADEDDSRDVDTCMMNHIKKQHFPELATKYLAQPRTYRRLECNMCFSPALFNLRNYRKHVHAEHPCHYATDPNILAHNVPCLICERPFERLINLFSHAWTHYNSTESKALVAQGFPDPRELRNTLIKTHAGYPCRHSNCSKTFRSNQSLKKHLFSHGSMEDRPKFLCDICGYAVTTQRGMRFHMMRHDPDKSTWKPCLICSSRFSNTTALTEHMNRCHGSYEERKFICELCELKFATNTDLKKHANSHQPSDWRAFKCHICPEAYRHKRNLLRHIASSHGSEFLIRVRPEPIHIEDKNAGPEEGPKQMFPCEKCGDKFFALKSRLKKHLKAKHSE